MGSYQLLNSHSDHQQRQVHNCSSSTCSLCSEMQRGCSKAQNCLFKILRIISTVPPHNNTSIKLNGCNGFAVDLNIEFNVPSEKTEEVEESGSSPVGGGQSTSTADEKCIVVAECGGVDLVKCSDDGGGETETPCKSDNSAVGVGVSETNKSGEEVKEGKGFMGLLIEAATLIFGDFKDENPKSECEAENKSFKSESTIEELKMDDHKCVASTEKQLKRRNDDCAEEIIKDKSSYPLVRSKRGRIQVLPNKYKDSILEPLTPFSRIRSTIVPNRRRSK